MKLTPRPILTFVVLVIACSRNCASAEPEPTTRSPLPGQQSVVPRSWDRYSMPVQDGWGTNDPSGLQLGAWADPKQPVVRCVIRNKGDKSVLYSRYLLGNWEAVTIKARPNPDAEWSVIPRLQMERLYYSAGASPKHVHLLWPGEEIRRELPPGANEAQTPKGPGESFSVELRDFCWPREWNGEIEVVVCQSLGRDGSEGTWQGTLESAPVRVSVDGLRVGVPTECRVPGDSERSMPNKALQQNRDDIQRH